MDFLNAPLPDCPPTVILCRVAYQVIRRIYKVNPLQFRNPEQGLALLGEQLIADTYYGLGATVCMAAQACKFKHQSLKLWRFDVCRTAGKAMQRRQDQRWYAYDERYPRITSNRGVASRSWLEDLPYDLPDVRTEHGRGRL